MINKDSFKRGFTLAETIITILTVIIIAATILPSLTGGNNEKVLAKKKDAFENKFNHALQLMQLKAKLSENYATSSDFAYELNKFMPVKRQCGKENLSNCFAQKIYSTPSTIKFDLAKMRTANALGANFAEDSDLVAVQFDNEVAAVIGYDKNCTIGSQYSSNTNPSACLIMLYDVNNLKGPNIIGADIGKINLNIKVDAVNLSFNIKSVFKPVPVDKNTCETMRNTIVDGYYIYSLRYCGSDDDYWAGALKECVDNDGRLPAVEEMQELASAIYGQKITSNSNSNLNINNKELWNEITNGQNSVTLWGNTDNSNVYANAFTFTKSSTSYYHANNRNRSDFRAICVKSK